MAMMLLRGDAADPGRGASARGCFRDRRQRAEVCRALLTRVGLADAWTADGPTIETRADLRRALDRVPPSALQMLLLCWAVWDETAILSFSDVFRFDGADLGMVGDLLSSVSRGPDEIDRWIRRSEPLEG
jgi:hypothetical protein